MARHGRPPLIFETSADKNFIIATPTSGQSNKFRLAASIQPHKQSRSVFSHAVFVLRKRQIGVFSTLDEPVNDRNVAGA